MVLTKYNVNQVLLEPGGRAQRSEDYFLAAAGLGAAGSLNLPPDLFAI